MKVEDMDNVAFAWLSNYLYLGQDNFYPTYTYILSVFSPAT